MVHDDILDHYRLGREHTRLATGAGRLEFLRTWDVLTRVLPPAPAHILDVGGATGVYAGPLAAIGYTVHVVDALPEHVTQAQTLPGVTAAVGDARALSEPDSSADAVLLLGPLYHLLERGDRIQAWRESARVVTPGAPIVAATISRYASLLDGYVQGFHSDPDYVSLVQRALDTGRHQNLASARSYFATAYFHHPEEIAAEVAEAGLALERIVGVESPLWLVGNHLDGILDDPATTATLLDQLRAVEAEPSLLGSSAHLLTIARRR